MFSVIFKLLKSQDLSTKYKLIFFQVIALLSSALETLTLISFIPIITIFMDINIIYNSEIYQSSNFLTSLSKKEIIYFMSLSSASIILLSFIMSLYVNHLNYKVAAVLGKTISLKIYKSFISKDIIFFNEYAPNEIIKTITFELPRLIQHVIQPFFRITVKASLIILITLVILIDSFAFSLVLFFIIYLYYLFFNLIFKNKISIIGKEISKNQSKIHQAVSETFNFIREIKIFNKESFFKNRYFRSSEKFYENLVKVMPIGQMPRIILENFFLMIVLLTVSIISMTVGPDNLTTILIKISFYIICVLKLIPAFQNTYYEYANIKAAEQTLKIIERIYFSQQKKNKDIKKVDFKKIIQFKNITFNYKQNENFVFKDINFKIYKNQSHAIIGKTGSGKSTLIDILCGLTKIKDGNILIDGKNIDYFGNSKWFENISIVKQNFFGLNDTILSNIILDNKFDQDKLDKVIKISQLKGVIKSKKNGLKYIIGENGAKLSGGQKQRLSIARSLYHIRDILILDEATSALDENTESLVLNAIKNEYKLTLILVTHNKKISNLMTNKIDMEKFSIKKNES